MLVFILLSLVALISLGVIVYIAFQKFPQLSNLDVNRLPREIEARKKRDLIRRRVANQSSHLLKRLNFYFRPLRQRWGKAQLQFRIYVGKIERLWHHEQLNQKSAAVSVPTHSGQKEQQINDILKLAEQCFTDKKWDQAEELYIAAVKKDPRCSAAYRGLGDTYLSKGSVNEALETYKFLFKLNPDDDAVLVKIADIYESKGELDKAITYTQQAAVQNDALSPRFYHLAELLLKAKQPAVAKEAILSAVELEPKNPKYLDLLVEIGILCGDKVLSENAYNELRSVNPENQKLADFAERIRHLK